MGMQNFIQLSAAGHELSTAH